MRVRLLFFAMLRDIAGAPEESLELHDGATAREVWDQLRARYADLQAYATPPMIAINEEYATPEAVLRDEDELAFIPPVAGG